MVEERSCGFTVCDCVSWPEFESSAAKLLGATTIKNPRSRIMISEMRPSFAKVLLEKTFRTELFAIGLFHIENAIKHVEHLSGRAFTIHEG